MPNSPCPCGSGRPFDDCCGPHLSGQTIPPTAEALMRSRYSAFAVGQADYLRATWHPTTRPATLTLEPGMRWLGLKILSTEAGGAVGSGGLGDVRRPLQVPGPRPALPGAQSLCA
jgi:SEC-C motif domain protein